MLTLYKNHGTGIGTWSIWSEGPVIFYEYAIVEDGATVRNSERVSINQSGRDLSAQVKLRIDSLVSRHKDQGYKFTRDEARLQGATNQLGLIRPMLAKQLKQVNKIDYHNAVIQLKLDGHRCLITNQNGALMAYTRQGKTIDTIGHILTQLNGLIPPGWTIDGELYTHGERLQTLSSWIKRAQPNSKRLLYVVYDVALNEPYKTRHKEMNRWFGSDGRLGWIAEDVHILPYKPYVSDEATRKAFLEAKKNGYEGLIIRTDDVGYEPGKRSSSLIKVKAFEDAEFKVIDMVPSKDGWGICVCETDVGKKFRVSAPGSVNEKTMVYQDRELFIGRLLTVAFAEYTKDGIPFQPTAMRWVEDS